MQNKSHSELKNQKVDLELLAQRQLFNGIPPQYIESVLEKCPIIHLDTGDILLSPGEENENLYFLVSGHLLVFLDEIDSRTSFHIHPGELIGEMSIIEDQTASAYVVADKPSSLISIHEDILWDTVASYPRAMRNMLRMFSQRMRKQNEVTRNAIEKQLKYEQMQRELKAAGNIQANILPKEYPLFPEHPQVDVFALMKPAKQVGGDFYDAFALDDDHICIAVGDVSGKGMPAALFMVRAITLLRMSLSKTKKFRNILPKLNKLLCKNNKDFTFLTLFVAMLNVKTGQLKYMNGGHNPPFISSNGKTFQMLPMPSGVLLGFSENVSFEMGEWQLQSGDSLFLYTDGITECENKAQKFFSVEQAREVLNTAVSTTPKNLITTLQKEVATFSRGVPQSDDITMLALKYFGDTSSSQQKF